VRKPRFEWDPNKARANLRKHGVSFEEAASSFEDPHGLFFPDLTHVDRLVLVAMSKHERLLVTVHAEVQDDIIRILSARRAEARERRRYHEENQ